VKVHRPSTRAEWLALRKKSIGASEAAALLGIHEYQSAYGLWAFKTGAIPADEEETPPMRRGRLLEPVAVQMLREERPEWEIVANQIPGGLYYVDEDLRLAATPDAFATCAERGRGLIQIKSVERSVFSRKWHQDGELNVPLWIAVQAIVEADLVGADWVAVAALVVSHGVDLEIVEVPLHDGIIGRIKSETANFWEMVRRGKRPDPDWKRDGRLIEALYDPTGEVIDLSSINYLPEIADEKELLSAQNRVNELRLKEIKAEFLARLGDASAARIADGRIITAKRVERAGYSVKPSSYVDVRVKKDRAA
jgi:hypothetical protein